MSKALHIAGKIAAYVAVIIVIYLLYMAVIPILSFSVYFEWWNKYKPSPAPASCFDMLSLAYYEKFKLYYNIRTALQPAESAFADPSWAILIKSIMFGGAYGYTTNDKAPSDAKADCYYVFPKDLCVSIIPDAPQNPATLSGFPDATDRVGWQNLMLKWGGVSDGIDNQDWKDFLGGASDAKPYNQIVLSDPWVNDINNFLWTKYNIPADSPMVIAYLTNFAEYNGDNMYPALLQFLLGGGTGSGGWWGFCQAGGSFGDRGYAEIARQIWADEVATMYNNPSSSTAGCGSTSGIASIATSAISMGGIGLMTGNPFAAAGLAVVGGVAGAAQQGCF